jgi:hypothetical protein
MSLGRRLALDGKQIKVLYDKLEWAVEGVFWISYSLGLLGAILMNTLAAPWGVVAFVSVIVLYVVLYRYVKKKLKKEAIDLAVGLTMAVSTVTAQQSGPHKKFALDIYRDGIIVSDNGFPPKGPDDKET